MAKASLKKTAASNAAARRSLLLGTGLTQLLHLGLLALVWSGPWRRTHKLLYLISTVLEGFLVFTLVSMSAPTRDAAGNILSAGEDLSQAGLTSYMFDIVYVTWSTHLLTALISQRFWWLYISIPAYAFYKIYTMFLHQRLFGGTGRSSAAPQPEVQEQLSRTQQKKQAREKNQQGQQVKYARR